MTSQLSHFKGLPQPEGIEALCETGGCFAEIILDELKSRDHEEVLYVDMPSGREVTVGEVLRGAIGLANELVTRGYKKGEVACIYSYNLPEYAVVDYACTLAGLTVTTCNSLYSYYELHHQLSDSGAKLLFLPGEGPFLERALKALGEGEGCGVREIVSITPLDTSNLEIKSSSQTPINFFKDILAEDQENIPKIDWDLKNDYAVILYSSGTTGLPKGVMHSHATFKRHVLQTRLLVKYFPAMRPENSVDFVVPPMFHIFGHFITILLGALTTKKIILQRRFNFANMLECIQKHRVTKLHVVPAIILQLTKDPSVENFDISSVRMLVTGAAPLSPGQIDDLLLKFKSKEPIVLFQAYAMTETPGTSTPPDTPLDLIKKGTVGKMSMGCEGKVVDINSGEIVPVGKEGEIWVLSNGKMVKYLNRDEETKKTITEDGWVRTGDVGYFNEDGYLFITDRIKELIKYKGYQVPPAELEAVLLTHPSVADVGVAGKPDEEAGQLPTAFVVLKPDTQCSAEDLQLYVKERSAPYKQLKGGVHFLSAIPRNATGKILRRKLFETLEN